MPWTLQSQKQRNEIAMFVSRWQKFTHRTGWPFGPAVTAGLAIAIGLALYSIWGIIT